MQFYTYAYLESQAQVSYLFQYGLIFFILVALVIITAKYMRNRLQSKYRDLSIILLLIGLFLSVPIGTVTAASGKRGKIRRG